MPCNDRADRKVESESTSPLEARLRQLKALFPEAVNENDGGIDFDALAALLGRADERTERYRFDWAGRQEAILSLHKPSRASLKPVRDESLNWDDTGHLFIEGENLEVLKLLHKSYAGRIKMIYIDPPYNTGNDYVYPDNYAQPLDQYLHETGQVDEAGNFVRTEVDRSGRKHSAWLSMMYPRLFYARSLLRDDGVIFVSIDDNEVHNLRKLMDQIFGEENFVATVIWEKKYAPQNDARWFSDNHDYVLVYARSKDTWRPNLLPRTAKANARYKNPDNDPRGPWMPGDLSVKRNTPKDIYPITTPSGRDTYPPKGRSWSASKKRFAEMVADNRIWFGKDGDNVPTIKRFLSEVKDGMTPLTIWPGKDVGTATKATRELRGLFGDTGVFDNPKPVGLIKRMIHLSSKSDLPPPRTSVLNEPDIILDFFAGSATSAQAVLEQNRQDGGTRKFIMVQMPQPMQHPEFDSIAAVGKERIRRVIARMQSDDSAPPASAPPAPASPPSGKPPPPPASPQPDSAPEDLGFRVFRLGKSALRQWEDLPNDADADEYARQLELVTRDALAAGWTVPEVITEVALKEFGFGLDCRIEPVGAVIEQAVHRVVDAAKEQHFYICLDEKIAFDALKPLSLNKDDRFVFRDSAVDDTFVANLALTCRIKSI